ncbi:hypothetical protein [Methylobacterium gnaphalii]|uniref:Uncharacterized protein n=1 Tax=Methylobacterium gnaphalii TaxID=1010610 RepID=A0A512JRX2_9HYPH|nr:hypothetical protein [Methylobacterium gnaphalii]GEP12714.1 hypothetical protein MGN01_45590 [Methylobacterium gnaphalii]GJD69961.1 hypothetical protein MMMDOFMJ_2900 [Methylobacterium gnaphalii]GLS50462.1 hypothetical protein GCM10007885_33140 [Methylobacterium gnaphalii]
MRETMLQDTAVAPYDADSDDKRVALGLVTEAFAEGCLDGLDGDCMAQAALFAAFQELVATYGEEAAASYAEGLPERIRSGGFTTALQH